MCIILWKGGSAVTKKVFSLDDRKMRLRIFDCGLLGELSLLKESRGLPVF